LLIFYQITNRSNQMPLNQRIQVNTPSIREAFKRNKPNEEGCEKINQRYETTLEFMDTVNGIDLQEYLKE